jgi:transcriptional regulator
MGSSNSVHTTLDLLVLTVLGRRGPLHGYAIASAIQSLSADALRIDEGSLYPALHRMEEVGWITAKSVVTENKRRARVYQITRAGRKQAAAESKRWNSLASSVSRVLRHA